MQWPGEPKVVNQSRPDNAMARGTKRRQSKKTRQCNGQGNQKSSIKEGQKMQWPGESKVVNQRRPDNAMDKGAKSRQSKKARQCNGQGNQKS